MPSSMMVRSAVKLVSNTASKPSAAKRRDHLAGHERTGRVVEALAQGGADRRGRLDDDVFVGSSRASHTSSIWLRSDGAHRAHGGALAALDADDLAEVLREGRADHGREAAALGEQPADALHVVAHRHAAPAGDALAGVADQGRGALVDHLERSSRPRRSARRHPGRRPACAARSRRTGRRPGSRRRAPRGAVRRPSGGGRGPCRCWSSRPCRRSPAGCTRRPACGRLPPPRGRRGRRRWTGRRRGSRGSGSSRRPGGRPEAPWCPPGPRP